MRIAKALADGTVTVVVDASGSKPEQRAVEELSAYLEAIGGHSVQARGTA